ncbi:MAG: PAS domain S-box protein [Hyphomonadaceae bacterium]
MSRDARTGDDALSAQLLASLESMADGFLLLDREWRFTYLNRRAYELLQRKPGELLGRGMWAEFPEGVGTVAEHEYSKVMSEGGSTTFEIDYPPLGVRLEVRAFATEGGGLSVFFRDVTEDHRIQSMMRMLQTAVSQLQDIVMVTELVSGTIGAPILFVNPAFERIIGYAPDEVVGRSTDFLGGRATDVAEVTRMRTALMAGRSEHGTVVFYTKHGAEVWLDVDCAAISADGTNRYTHVVTVARDITERRRAEQALREYNERFRIVAQATADVVWDWNLVADTIWWSDGMRARFGYAYDDTALSGDSWVRHIHPDDVERVDRDIHAVIDGDGEKWSDEYRFIRANGSVAQVADRGFVIRDSEGRAIRMVGSMVDVTEQRELEAQLRQAQRLDAVGKLTGGVAHDFNNLLTVILSNSETLETRLANNPPLHALAEMTRLAAERGAELTSRLLAFSRRQPLDPKPTDVSALVHAMAPLLRRALGEQIDVRIHPADALWDAHVDGLQLESAILNLCINARDAMNNSGRIDIAFENAVLEGATDMGGGEFVLVSVTDHGVGMDEATLARVFEPFFTTKDVGKGSGLGLSMVYGFITQSKGRVSIETAPGQGAIVKLYLPRAREARADAPAPRSVGARGGDERILLVEDDPLVRTQVAGDLERLGYKVVAAASGAEALKMLESGGGFDLLFTDVVMAGDMNGRELADAARAIAPRLPVLYTSGNAQDVLVQKGRLTPGVCFLGKPYRRQDLAQKLREALASFA